MACPVCGKPSPCAHEQKRSAHSGAEPAASPVHAPVPEGEIMECPDQEFWRQEVASRVQQHRARRRRRVDPHATLELAFPSLPEPEPVVRRPVKIIEFPRSAIAHERPWEHQNHDLELAEPVIDKPRIVEAPEPLPEQMTLLPTFADIRLEAEETRLPEGFDLSLQPAPVTYRLFAGLLDMMAVIMAWALFVIGFVIFEGGLPQFRPAALCGFIVAAGFWFLYQYLFLAYASSTPGMQFAQLELCTFQGEPAPLKSRRGRALASLLSALALGLGFAWALLDEDTLGWHDRITQTYLRRKSN